MALPVQSIFETLHDAGIHVRPADGGLLVATPASRLTDELRALIRSRKADLIRWFTSTAANDPEPPEDPAAWRELAQEYHRHHFACKTCCAAGQSRGLRCGVGASLWTNYQNQI